MQANARNFKVPAGSFQARIADRMPGLLGCGRDHALALQLHCSSEVSAASVGLVSSPPERPCENTVDRDAPLSELDSDATDFLDRPAESRTLFGVPAWRFFLGAESALA